MPVSYTHLPSKETDYKYGNTNPTNTSKDLDIIKKDLDNIRKKLDDKSEHVFGFDGNSYQACGTDTKGEAMDWLNRLMGDLTGYDEPQDFADIFISGNITDESEVSSYVRDLDLRTGLASVSYNWKGVHYTREYFNSYPDNVLAVHLSANQKGCLSFSVCLKAVSYTHLSVDDVIEILAVNLIGTIPDDEQIVISTNQGEPLSGRKSPAEEEYSCLLYTSRCV